MLNIALSSEQIVNTLGTTEKVTVGCTNTVTTVVSLVQLNIDVPTTL